MKLLICLATKPQFTDLLKIMAGGLPYTIVDAFATRPFTGNPAAVLLLNSQLSDDLMQRITA